MAKHHELAHQARTAFHDGEAPTDFLDIERAADDWYYTALGHLLSQQLSPDACERIVTAVTEQQMHDKSVAHSIRLFSARRDYKRQLSSAALNTTEIASSTRAAIEVAQTASIHTERPSLWSRMGGGAGTGTINVFGILLAIPDVRLNQEQDDKTVSNATIGKNSLPLLRQLASVQLAQLTPMETALKGARFYYPAERRKGPLELRKYSADHFTIDTADANPSMQLNYADINDLPVRTSGSQTNTLRDFMNAKDPNRHCPITYSKALRHFLDMSVDLMDAADLWPEPTTQ